MRSLPCFPRLARRLPRVSARSFLVSLCLWCWPCCLAAPAAVRAETPTALHGHVADRITGRALAGVRVQMLQSATKSTAGGTTSEGPQGQETSAKPVTIKETSTDDHGHFAFAGLSQGPYRVRLSRVGYASLDTTLIAPFLPEEAAAMPAELTLAPQPIPTPEVEVTTTRAEERKSAVAFTELDRTDIAQDYWAQDVPILLTQTPSVMAYSDAGNGLGYSYIKIRGFPQRRVGVTFNGIPENDPESHEVYWVDQPDLLASTQVLQVQRGTGSALYGSSALGGSVDLETPAYPTERLLRLTAGYGTFNTRRYSAEYQSGLIDSQFSVSGRYSRILSDGYRDQSWVKLWSYYLSMARVGERLSSRLNLYGGPENLHLAYYGVDRPSLQGQVTGDVERDRRANPLSWKDETDNFYEPHYELIQNLKLSEQASATSSLFFFSGEGYYNDFPFGPQDFASHKLPEFEVDSDSLFPAGYYVTDSTGAPARQSDGRFLVVASDMTQRLWVQDRHYGWVPRARIRHARGELTLGGEWRQHDGRHYGQLTWAQALPPGTDPEHVFYDYTGRVRVFSTFAQEAYQLRPDVTATASLQWRGTRYAIGDDPFNHYDFSLNYSFLNPRLGLNWNLDPRWNAFASFAHAHAEPILSEIYRPDDPSSVPLFRVVDVVHHIYDDPLVQPERLNDYEAGAGFRGRSGYFRLTGFWMDFRGEIVPSGQIDRLGNPITGNAARSAHKGIELEGSVVHRSGFEVSGNLSLSRNRFSDYREFVDSSTTNDYSGNAIAGFPDALGNLSLGLRRGSSRVALRLAGVGTQYLDNSQDNRKDPALRLAPGYSPKLIPGYVTVNADMTLDLGPLGGGSRRLGLDVHAVNLAGRRYETSGYVYAEVPYFFPAAGRNVFVSLKAEF